MLHEEDQEKTNGNPARKCSTSLTRAPMWRMSIGRLRSRSMAARVFLRLATSRPAWAKTRHDGRCRQLLPPPYGIADNAHSLLDVTDLVLSIRSAPVTAAPLKVKTRSISRFQERYRISRRLHSPVRDAQSALGVTQIFDRRKLRHDTCCRPKRSSAERIWHVPQRHHADFVGPDFQTLLFTPNNDLPYVLFLPTYAATAWYHKRLSAELMVDLPALLAEVTAFAETTYASALMQGAKLDAATEMRWREQLAQYTGVSPISYAVPVCASTSTNSAKNYYAIKVALSAD